MISNGISMLLRSCRGQPGKGEPRPRWRGPWGGTSVLQTHLPNHLLEREPGIGGPVLPLFRFQSWSLSQRGPA